jgi:metal-responsive CopG/Arc/MetJ family transcriptional regulator
MAQNERIAITIDPQIVIALKKLVEERMYPSVSFAIESMARAQIKEINKEKKLSSKKDQKAVKARIVKKDKEKKQQEK